MNQECKDNRLILYGLFAVIGLCIADHVILRVRGSSAAFELKDMVYLIVGGLLTYLQKARHGEAQANVVTGDNPTVVQNAPPADEVKAPGEN